jgi:hypothetical protein
LGLDAEFKAPTFAWSTIGNGASNIFSKLSFILASHPASDELSVSSIGLDIFSSPVFSMNKVLALWEESQYLSEKQKECLCHTTKRKAN